MKNDFTDLLHGERDEAGRPWTITKLAEGIYASRAHVNKVLLNRPGPKTEFGPDYGKWTRPKLVRFFKGHFTTWPAMLAVLGWDETGAIVPHGTCDMTQTP